MLDKTIEVPQKTWELIRELFTQGSLTIKTTDLTVIIKSSRRNTFFLDNDRINFGTPLTATLQTVVKVGPLKKSVNLDFKITYLELLSDEVFINISGPVDLKLRAER